MEIGNIFIVNYIVINLYCNCIIILRFNGSLSFEIGIIKENCFIEIVIYIL